jgi:hypothetical protein
LTTDVGAENAFSWRRQVNRGRSVVGEVGEHVRRVAGRDGENVILRERRRILGVDIGILGAVAGGCDDKHSSVTRVDDRVFQR